MKKLELIITVTNDGVYITKTERINDVLSGEQYINRRYDHISIDIQNLENKG